jgi:Arc-like DNA binding domain
VPKKATEFTQFKLRIREGLRRQIEKEAKKNGRSANAEAVERLEASFAQQVTTDLINDAALTTGKVVLGQLLEVLGKVIEDKDWRPTMMLFETKFASTTPTPAAAAEPATTRSNEREDT